MFRRFRSLAAVVFMLTGNAFCAAQTPAPAAVAPGPTPITNSLPALSPSFSVEETTPIVGGADAEARGFLQSDRAFEGFIGPISNPILTKDPRSLTEIRPLFISNKIDPASPFGSGSFQVYALQLRLALTERLTFIADKDGYAVLNPKGAPSTGGWLNLAAGLKYTLIRDVDNQFLAAGTLMFEPQTGEGKVFQNQGTGVFSVIGTAAKEFGSSVHLLGNMGYQFPVDVSQNSSFYFLSAHLDKQMFGWLYPLIEMNWYHYLSSGNRGIPPAVGEGDGLINIGTSGVAGNDLVTTAIGAKARLSWNAELGAAWEFPISTRHDLINNRVLAELILRY